MALLKSLFQNRLNIKNSEPPTAGYDAKTTWKRPTFFRDEVRLIVYRNNEQTLLFDSKAIVRVIPGKCGQPAQTLNTPQQNRTRSSDIKDYGEMVFGTVAMYYHGDSLKVHMVGTPPQLMVTRVCQQSGFRDHNSDSDSYLGFSPASTPDQHVPKLVDDWSSAGMARSLPMDVPLPSPSDNGLCDSTASSTTGSNLPSPASSVSSNNSYVKRYTRHEITRLSNGARNRNKQEPPVPISKRPPRIGIALVFSMPQANEENGENSRLFQHFFFSHITLIENYIISMSNSVDKAMHHKQTFHQEVYMAFELFRNSIGDLYTAPRLLEPVWLNMMTFSTHRVSLCQRFLKEFVFAIDRYENRNFLSTLLTAVLTYHLAWVPTVTPAGASPSRTYMDKHTAKWIDALAKSHPYNPLWAQLSDLYGAIGYPMKLTRTVLYGKKYDVISRLLYILTYFIRCSEIRENTERLIENDSPPLRKQKDYKMSSQDKKYAHFTNGAKTYSRQTNGKQNTAVDKQRKSTMRSNTHYCSNCQKCTVGTPCKHSSPSTPNQTVTYTNPTPALHETSVRLQEWKEQGKIPKFIRTTPSVCDRPDQRTSGVPERNNSDCDVSDLLMQGLNPLYEARKALEQTNNKAVCSVCPSDVNDQPTVETELKLGRSVITEMPDKMVEVQHEKRQLSPTLPKASAKTMHTRSISRLSTESDRTLTPVDSPSFGNIEDKPSSQQNPSQAPLQDNMFDEYFKTPEGGSSPITLPKLDVEPISCVVGSVKINASSNNTLEKLKQDLLEIDEDDASTTSRLEGMKAKRPSTLSLNVSMSDSQNSVCTMCGEERISYNENSKEDDELTEDLQFYQNLQPIDMPNYDDTEIPARFYGYSYGRSLLAGYSDHYLSDFVIHGTSDHNYLPKLQADLTQSVQNSVLDEPIAESGIIVADTENWVVKLRSCKSSSSDRMSCQDIRPSQMVKNIVDTIKSLYKIKMSAEFILMHLEDRLQEIYFKSKIFSEYVRSHPEVNLSTLTRVLDLDVTDLPLLVAVASTHTPYLQLVPV